MLATAQPNAPANAAPTLPEQRRTFRRIFVAVDGGPSSADAVETAARLAAQLGATLALMHCIDTGPLAALPPDRAQRASDEAVQAGAATLGKLAALVPTELPHEAILR